ncbi:MAG TPA: hypothetical protein P5096_03295 [Patescibacteria group bacterium]|nr:hypothetical protein [Patescibacteria group bacterium]
MLKKISTTLLITASILIFSNQALAQETTNTISSSVSPALISLKLDKGETKSSSYEYVNGTDDNLIITISTRAFAPSNGEHGTPLFIDKDGKKVTSPLTSWIKLNESSMSVKKGEKATVNFQINVPSDAKEGKYFAAIFNTETDGGSDSGSLVKKELGVTLVVEVLAPKPIPGTTTTTWQKDNLLSYIIFGAALLALLLLIAAIFKRKKKTPKFFPEEERKELVKKVKRKVKITKNKK